MSTLLILFSISLEMNTINKIRISMTLHTINKIRISMTLLKNVIKNESKDVMLLLTKEYQKKDRFKNSWYRYALTYQKLELIDHLFRQDPKSSRYKVWSILFEVQKFPHNLRLMLDLKKLQKLKNYPFLLFFT